MIFAKDSTKYVIYALMCTMYGEIANILSLELLDAEDFDPFKLWALLSKYYNTS